MARFRSDCGVLVGSPVLGPPRCTTTIADGKVYALGAEGDLSCLDAETGKLIWVRLGNCRNAALAFIISLKAGV